MYSGAERADSVLRYLILVDIMLRIGATVPRRVARSGGDICWVGSCRATQTPVKPHRGTIAMSSLAFPAMSLQALASMALHHRQLRQVPDVVRPHVVATIYTSLLARLRPTVTPTDRLTVTGLEPDTRVYGKRKYAAISRADVSYAEYFQPMEVE